MTYSSCLHDLCWGNTSRDTSEEPQEPQGANQNQRGLFLVNIVSKVYEKVKKNRMKLNTTKCQKCKQQAKNRDQ